MFSISLSLLLLIPLIGVFFIAVETSFGTNFLVSEKKIKLKISARLVKKRSRRGNGSRSKMCRFCVDKQQMLDIDYKNSTFLKSFLTE